MGQKPTDEYPTPPKLAREITRLALSLHPMTPATPIFEVEHSVVTPLHVLEPGAGQHAPFLQAAVDLCGDGVHAYGVELHDHPQPIPGISWRSGRDFLQVQSFRGPFDLVITNPPFSLAQEFVAKCHREVHPWGLVVFLLQTGFNGAKDRIEFWSRYRPIMKRTIRPRPGFIKSATPGSKASRDMREYMVVVWPGPALGRFLANVRRDWCEDGYLDCPHPKGWGMVEE